MDVKTYPAPSRTVHGQVNSVSTEITTTSFTDRILITIAQEGRLAQWIQVPLSARDPQGLDGPLDSEAPESSTDDETDLLPMPHLTAKTLFGAANEERETTGQLYATQIASSILNKQPDETRILLVGLGLKDAQPSREQFFDLLELVMQTI